MTDVQMSSGSEHTHDDPVAGTSAPRRAVLAGAGALGATCFLAACGTRPAGTGGLDPNGSDYEATPAPAGSGRANAQGGSGGKNSGGAITLAAVADVPEGGGVIKGDFVITQPAAGVFKAFSKVCTHQGCDVNKVDGGLISCPCHGSQFSISDGSVKAGPAPRGLPQTSVKVDGKNIVKA